MQTPRPTVPFGVATYKVNYHDASSRRDGLKERIQGSAATDVWCVHGVNLSRHLKGLPDSYKTFFPPGQALVYNSLRVSMVDKDSVNLFSALIAAAEQRPSIADSFAVSRYHLSKLRLFASFAAFEMLPQALTASVPAAREAGTSAQLVAHRILVVSLDLEKFRRWGDAFTIHLLLQLCRLVWEDGRAYAGRWSCAHVCVAGSFFFAPGSAPYEVLTALSGGLIETRVPRLLVHPFCSRSLESEESESSAETNSEVTQMCMLALETQGGSRCRQLLALQIRCTAGSGSAAAVLPSTLYLTLGDAATGDYAAGELRAERDGDGWWVLPKPLDVFTLDVVLMRVRWSAAAPVAAPGADLSFRLRVRSFGVVTPHRQAADGAAVGQALLSSATANTVSLGAAAAMYAEVERRAPSSAALMEPLNEERQKRGEPVVTALYRAGADIEPGCHDYIFVSTFTGLSVLETSSYTLDDFASESATPHLPVMCTVGVPCELR